MPLLTRRWMRSLGLASLFVAAAAFGTASGLLYASMGDLPSIAALEDQKPGTITRILGAGDVVVGEFAEQRRELVTYDQIPAVLRNAIMSAEDKTFETNSGVDVSAIIKTIARRAVGRQTSGGASTLTQQLARNLLSSGVGNERRGFGAVTRKVREWVVAVQIAKRYTKPEVMTMYCNTIFWGHATYGLGAASQMYFSKAPKDLTLDEAAMLAGIIQSPERQSPYNDRKAAKARRDYTLGQMEANGYITKAQADAAKARPVVPHGAPSAPRSIAPYFAEQIRIQLEKTYGAKAILQEGLTVHTSLDPAMQQTANKALAEQLREMDRKKGHYRKPVRNLVAEGKPVESYKNVKWQRDPVETDYWPGMVTSVDNGVIHGTAGKWTWTIGPGGYAWTGRKPDTLVHRGDVIEVKIMKINDKATSFTAALSQTPELEGAVLAINNHTGEVLVWVGGKDFQTNQFDRVRNAKRQVGSLFKAFVYTTAIDRGMTVMSDLPDQPASYVAGPNQPFYQPKNFDKKFEGTVTLKWALEESRNVPTIALMDKLGPQNVVDTARKFGLTGPLPPLLPIAIGAGADTLWEMVGAYTTFPNQGVRVTPVLFKEVTDREGNVLEEHRPDPHEVIRADTAYIMTNIFQGVIDEGTANGTRQWAPSVFNDWPLGGKTGTTDDATDGWFVGFDPDVTIGVWIGYDQMKSMGETVQGALTALPVWREIMKTWVERRRKELGDAPVFEVPGNITFVATDKGTQPFIVGTEPKGKG